MTEQLIQGSTEWLQARCGLVTASRVADIVAKTKSGYSASRANYMAELIAERLTGQPAPSYSNAAMEWGTLNEQGARAAYEFFTDASVVEVGFIKHPTIDQAGASPDGLVADDGLVEIKCPNTSTHIDTLIGGKVPGKYQTQMLWQMACTGRQWCDFLSYDPRLPANIRTFVKRLHRDDAEIERLETEVRAFLDELSEKIDALNNLNMKEAA